MTNQSQDVFFAAARSQYQIEQPLENTIRGYEVYGPDGKRVPGVTGLEITIRDMSGGFGKYQGPLTQFSNKVAEAAGLHLVHPGYAQLAQLTTEQTSPVPSGTIDGLHWVNVFGTLIVFAGSGTNVAAFKETSATDPALTAITYDPTSTAHVISASVVDFSNGKHLVIGLAGQPYQTFTTNTGTLGTAGDSATGDFYGVIQTSLPHSSLNGFVLLALDADGNIKTGSTNAAANQVWATATNLAGNFAGVAVGEYALSGAPARAWFWINSTEGEPGLTPASEDLGQLWNFNLEGRDPQILAFNEMPGGIYGNVTAVNSPIYGQGFVATNRKKAIFHNGSQEINLRLFSENVVGQGGNFMFDSDWTFQCDGFRVQGGILDALVTRRESGGATATQASWWRLNWEMLAWQQISSLEPVADDIVVMAARGFPVSDQTGFSHILKDDGNLEWDRQFVVPEGENPYFLHRRTSGASGGGKEFEGSGEMFSPHFELPLPFGTAYVVEALAMDADVRAGGTDATADLEVFSADLVGTAQLGTNQQLEGIHLLADEASTGYEASHRRLYFKSFPQNKLFFYKLLYLLELTRGSTTQMTPAVFSISFRLLCFPGGETTVISRADIDAGVKPPRAY